MSNDHVAEDAVTEDAVAEHRAMTSDDVRPSSSVARGISAAVGVVLFALIVLLAVSGGDEEESSSRLLGNRVPSIAGTTLSGDTFDIDASRGRWVLVNFFATWCAPCIAEHPDLVELETWGAETGQLDLVSIVFDDDPENVADLFDQLGGDWPVLTAPQTVVDFQVRRVPESFLIDPNGVVVGHVISGVTAEVVVNEIARP
jgi:cytochrome c biogenesis protein CcmG, thiol:disulfide interchange protein DsbE